MLMIVRTMISCKSTSMPPETLRLKKIKNAIYQEIIFKSYQLTISSVAGAKKRRGAKKDY